MEHDAHTTGIDNDKRTETQESENGLEESDITEVEEFELDYF
jgi:hypothetical protein